MDQLRRPADRRAPLWAGLGYAQLSVNVRGASNYDDAFMRGNQFDIGGGDRRDLESGVDAVYDMERWFIGGNPWTEPEQWRARGSLTYADRVRTPTLLHHGDEDDSCSPFQSMNFFAALRTFGTPARLIRYPGEGHDFRQPAHLRLRDTQDVAWMQWFVRGIGEAPVPSPPR